MITINHKADENSSNGCDSRWHSRGYLPHFESTYVIQMVTYRLADALPREVAQRLSDEMSDEKGDAAYRKRIEAYLDTGYGSCVLRHQNIAQVVYDSLLFNNNERYCLHAWVIMPNHIHVLLQVISPRTLSRIIKGWKSFTAREINKLLGSRGKVWQDDYWDRYVRDERHYSAATQYIHENPVKAGLVARQEDWPWSSCRKPNKE